MTTYECGSNTRKWWIHQAGATHVWVASPPLSADGPNLPTETFTTFQAAVDHYVTAQRSLAANRLAQLLAGGAL